MNKKLHENLRQPKVVAEIGCNHRGDFETAKEMVMIASQFCKADVVKFQKRNPSECLAKAEYNTPHTNSNNSYGKTYGEHREYLEFTLDEHRKLHDICRSYNIEYSASVWDLTSAKEIISLQPTLIKVPSACNTYFDLLALLCDKHGGEIHISLGMTNRKEEEDIIKFLSKKSRLKDVVLYHCTSGYPVPFEDLYLMEISRLAEMYGNKIKSIGFSGHHLGIAIDVAAFTLGADWIERHFTLDRTWKGTDHAASLEADGLRRVVRNVKHAALTLQFPKKEILDIEIPTRKKLKWGRGIQSFDANEIAPGTIEDKKTDKPEIRAGQGEKELLSKIKILCVDVDGTLTDGGMYYSEKGETLKRFNTRDAVGLSLLMEAGIKIAIVTGENNPIVKARAKKLKIGDVLIGIKDKKRAVKALLSKYDLDWYNLAYIGDDINDHEVLLKAGFSACPDDALVKTKEKVDYICKVAGGYGAVREFCELIIQKK